MVGFYFGNVVKRIPVRTNFYVRTIPGKQFKILGIRTTILMRLLYPLACTSETLRGGERETYSSNYVSSEVCK